MWFERECRRVETLLWIMAQGKADDRQTARVQAHLRHCPACRAQWQACRQTQIGLVALRDRPIPISQTNWQMVQARIAADDTGPGATRNTRGELSWYRAAVTGRRALLTGAASMLALCLLLARPGVSPPQTNNSSPNEKSGVAKAAKSMQPLRPLKPTSQFAAFTLLGAMPALTGESPPGMSGLGWTAGREERHGDWMPSVRRSHTRPYNRRGVIPRAGRRRRLALALLHRRMRPTQTAADWKNTDGEVAESGLAVTVQAGRMEPEYVLTTVEGASSAPRSFIMDSINVDAQHTGQANVDGLAIPPPPDDMKRNLKNGLNSRPNDIHNNVPAMRADVQAVKEIQAW